MPVLKVFRYVRADAREFPKALFLFGDNCERRGLGGQAREMRGQPNAIGVRTKHTPGRDASAYFSDDEFDRVTSWMAEDLRPVVAHLAAGDFVVVPADGLGTGLSKLPQRAPRVAAWLDNALKELENVRAE